MSGIGPPKDTPPDELFRRVLQFPWPRMPIDFRFECQPNVCLWARAVHWRDYLTAMREERSSILVCASLIDESGQPIFSSPRAAESALMPSELGLLAAEVLTAIDCCGPLFMRSDGAAWSHALEQGAAKNVFIADALASCRDVSCGPQGTYFNARPDRYFGRPTGDLLDCQWMAYRAARRVIDKIQGQ